MTIKLNEPGQDGAGRLRFEIIREKPRRPNVLIASATVVGDEVHQAWWSNTPMDFVELRQLGNVLHTITERAKQQTGLAPTPTGPNGGGTPETGGGQHLAAAGSD